MSSIKEKLGHYAWDIAYGTYTERMISEGFGGIKIRVVKNPYKNKWFADPFILEENDEYIQFFAEEFDYSVGKGRLARLKVSKRDDEIKECSIILELSTHLSFPAIYRVDGEVYVHPENSASGASYMYYYDRETDKLVDPKLIVAEPVADAIIRKNGEKYDMFATRVPETNGCVLHRYVSENLFGPYRHVGEENFEKNTARMAGMFLQTDNGTVRPAQDCWGGYGKAVVMYRGHRQLCRIEPTCWKYAGIHTFNILEGSFVIDLKRYDYPLLYKLSRMIKR